MRIGKLNQVRAGLHHLRTHDLEILWSRRLEPKDQAAALHVPLQLPGLFRTEPTPQGVCKVIGAARRSDGKLRREPASGAANAAVQRAKVQLRHVLHEPGHSQHRRLIRAGVKQRAEPADPVASQAGKQALHGVPIVEHGDDKSTSLHGLAPHLSRDLLDLADISLHLNVI